MIAVAVVAGSLALGGGAVGLVVPDAGPRTSEERARAALVCGAVVNSLRGELPECERSLVRIADEGLIRVQLPSGGDQPNDRRYPIVVEGEQGLLTSDSTRIPGLVSIADIGQGRLEVVPHDDPLQYLSELDRRIDENGRNRVPAFLVALGVLAALALVSGRAAVSGFALVLAANLALGAAGVSELWAVLLTLALAALAGAVLRAPVALSVAVLAAYLGVLATEGTWVSLSPLGPSQNARFFGLSNLLETLLLVPALVGGRRSLAVAVLAVVMIAGGSFGADGGGAVVLVAGYMVLRGVLSAVPLGGAAALAIWLGPSTHVTAAGGGAFFDRIELSAERLADDWVIAAITGVALLALAVLAWRGRRARLPLAFAAAVAVSMVVNDSPFEVALAGLVGYLAVRGYDSRR